MPRNPQSTEPTKRQLLKLARGRQRVISKLPRDVPEIESVPWVTNSLSTSGERIVVSLPRVRFLEREV